MEILAKALVKFGSKPISIAREYIKLNEIVKEKGIDFLWITDG